MKRRGGLTAPLVMLGVCLALGYFVQAEMNRDRVLAPVSVGAAPAAETVSPSGRAAPRATPIRSFKETLDRPLFHASRRPAPKQVAATVDAPAPNAPKLKLVGVIIEPEGRSALVRVAGAAGPIEIYVGERIEGWRLEAIQTDRIVLKSGKLTETYRIDAE
jgi:hypothetical protein